jgi:hypothetical protein
MNTEATHAFIGQDAKAILKGYPRIAKALNLITDTAGRANVLMEGGGMEESDCDCDDKEMNGEGIGQSNELLAALSVPERNIYRILKNRSSTLARRPYCLLALT